MITDGETGFLATTPDEWVAADRRCWRGDARLRRQMGLAGSPARRVGLLGLGLGRDLRDSMTGTCRSARRHRPGRSIGRHRRTWARRFEPHAAQGENASYSQPDWRSMSSALRTNDRRSPALESLSRLQETQASEGIRRMFKPPEWEWSQFGDVGWWSRDGWGDVLLGPDGLRLDEWRERGRLTTIKSGPHRVVYRVDLPEGTIYIKHFLVPDWRATLRQWVRRGKGRNEGKRSAAPGLDRSADDHADRAGRTPEAEVPLRELPGHAGDLVRDSARRVRRAPSPEQPEPVRSQSARSWPRRWPS